VRNRPSGQLVLRKDEWVLPLLDTRVTFPSGGLTATAEVLAVTDLAESGRKGVVTDVSPFHPVNGAWPDQGADAGVMAFGDDEVDVVEGHGGLEPGLERHDRIDCLVEPHNATDLTAVREESLHRVGKKSGRRRASEALSELCPEIDPLRRSDRSVGCEPEEDGHSGTQRHRRGREQIGAIDTWYLGSRHFSS